jgi:hypothetical protein
MMSSENEIKFVSINHADYIDLYRQYKDLLNPHRFNYNGTYAVNSAHFDWHKLGVEYYDTNPNGKKFKLLDYKKWMHHLMLAKI